MNYDALIILGSGISKDGSLPPGGLRRVEQGVAFWQETPSHFVIMSGGVSFSAGFSSPLSEAQAMKSYAVSLGLPEAIVLIEDQSTDTLGNIYFSKQRYLVPQQLTRILVVTSEYHLERARWLCAKVLGPQFTVDYRAVDTGLTPAELESKAVRENNSLRFSKEMIGSLDDGDDEAVRRFMYTDHPGYATNPTYSTADVARIIDSYKDTA